MSSEGLRQLLARLREQLHAGSSLDAEARAQLREVARDIDRALGPPAPAAAADAPAAGMTPRLESLAVRFEAGHPALAETLREIVDALARAGI